MMRKIEVIALAILAVTAIAAISALKVSLEELSVTEPQETACEPATAPTATETTEATQAPTEATLPATEATEPEETTVETEPEVIRYDVPLSQDLQLYIIRLCEGKNIDPAVVLAMIWKESRFNPSSVGDGGNSFGLMQIQPRWHSGLMAELGCNDLLDPYQNVTVGITILAGHLQRWEGNLEMAVVSYNSGATGAYNNYFSKGVYASPYSLAVMEKAEELKNG